MESQNTFVLPGLDGTDLLIDGLCQSAPSNHRVKVLTLGDDPLIGYRELCDYFSGVVESAGPCTLVGESFSGPACRASSTSASKLRASPRSGCDICHHANATNGFGDSLVVCFSAAATAIFGSAFFGRVQRGVGHTIESGGPYPVTANACPSHAGPCPN